VPDFVSAAVNILREQTELVDYAEVVNAVRSESRCALVKTRFLI
jgi:hypothetical protein